MAEEVTTSIDDVLSYVTEHGEVNIETIASVLHIEISIVEKCARVLEEANLVKITNKSGKEYLKRVTGAPG